MSARKSRGAVLVAEVTPASLACDGGQYYDKSWRQAASLIVTPPIRWAAALQILPFYNMCVQGGRGGRPGRGREQRRARHRVQPPRRLQQPAEGPRQGQLRQHPQGSHWRRGEDGQCRLASNIFYVLSNVFEFTKLFPQVVLWQKCVRSGAMSRQRFVEATSAGAAKILNIYPQKGR